MLGTKDFDFSIIFKDSCRTPTVSGAGSLPPKDVQRISAIPQANLEVLIEWFTEIGITCVSVPPHCSVPAPRPVSLPAARTACLVGRARRFALAAQRVARLLSLTRARSSPLPRTPLVLLRATST
jgi:hypothetical protein